MNTRLGIYFGVAVAALAIFFVWRELNEESTLPERGIQREVRGAEIGGSDPLSNAGFTSSAIDASSSTPSSRHLVMEPSDSAMETSTGERFEVLGRVLDPTGLPYRGATIHIREQVESKLHAEDARPFSSVEFSGVEGEFAVAVPRPGSYVVWSSATGFATSALGWITIEPSDAPVEIDLVLEEAQMISGVVLGEDMLPAKGVEVVAYVDADLSRVQLPRGVTSLELYGQERTNSAEDGSFQLGPLKGRQVLFLVQGTATSGDSRQFQIRDLGSLEKPDSKERLFGELRNVAPGSSDLKLLLSSASRSGTLRVELTTRDGGRYPNSLNGVLQQLGPNGGIYHSRKVQLQIDDVGVGTLSSLIPGRRYSLDVTATPGATELNFGPLFATGGELVLRATLPGLFETKVRIHDPHGHVPGHARLLIVRKDFDGKSTTVSDSGLKDANGEHVILAPAGKCFVHLGARVWTSEGTLRALPSQEVQIPLSGDCVLIEVP